MLYGLQGTKKCLLPAWVRGQGSALKTLQMAHKLIEVVAAVACLLAGKLCCILKYKK